MVLEQDQGRVQVSLAANRLGADGLALQIVLPALCVGLALVFSLIAPPFGYYPALRLSPSMYGSHVSFFRWVQRRGAWWGGAGLVGTALTLHPLHTAMTLQGTLNMPAWSRPCWRRPDWRSLTRKVTPAGEGPPAWAWLLSGLGFLVWALEHPPCLVGSRAPPVPPPPCSYPHRAPACARPALCHFSVPEVPADVAEVLASGNWTLESPSPACQCSQPGAHRLLPDCPAAAGGPPPPEAPTSSGEVVQNLTGRNLSDFLVKTYPRLVRQG